MEQPAQVAEYYRQELRHLPSIFRTRDGKLLYARLIRREDAPLLIDLFDNLSTDTRRRRFHADADHVNDERKQSVAQQLADVDNRTYGGAVLAIERDAEAGERIVGVARLARPEGQPDAPQAEAAIVVRDDYQGRGVGTELLRRMMLLAKQMQLESVLAIIEANNARTLRVFRNLSLSSSVTTSRAETHMVIQVPRENAFAAPDEAQASQLDVPEKQEKRGIRRWLHREKARD